MASRSVLIVDAKADKALRELDRLRRKMESTQTPVRAMNRGMGQMAGRLAGMLGPAAAVGAVFAGWRRELELAEQAQQRVTRDLRDVAAGAGLIDDLPELRAFIRTQKSFRTQQQTIAGINSFMGAAPTASAEQAMAVAQGLDLDAAINPSNANTMFSLAGSLVMAGQDVGTASNFAVGLSRAAGRQAPRIARNIGRVVQPLAGLAPIDDVLTLMLATAQGDERVSSLAPLIASLAEGNPELLSRIVQDPQNVNIPGVDAGRMASLRNLIPQAARDVAGFRSSRRLTAFQLPDEDQRELMLALGRRRIENRRTSGDRIEDLQESDAFVLEEELRIEEYGPMRRRLNRAIFSIFGDMPVRMIGEMADRGPMLDDKQIGFWSVITEQQKALERIAGSNERMANRPATVSDSEGMQ